MRKYILFYDSGIGGLSTLKNAIQVMPNESFIYFADNKNMPYGNKSKDEISAIVLANILKLTNKFPIKMIVLACNTATSCAKSNLEKCFSFPIVGIEPAVKLAVSQSKSREILCIATKATICGDKYKHLVKSLDAKVYSCFLKNLASKIEQHFFDNSIDIKGEVNLIKNILHNHPNIDQIVLGCTHYSLISNIISAHIPISLVDGNEGVARQIKKILTKKKQLKTSGFLNLQILLSSNNASEQKKYLNILEKILKD